ncbi:MAG: bifunctional nuclease family protein, partial [Candidatus Omnitrophica bacterium]|nr:bifunctional nuclease family protein [Candidatus Omnitrophota bacterium]
RVEVENIVLNIATSTPIVILKDKKAGFILPIVIGLFEAQAILLILEKEDFPRPLTHDLLRSVIEKMNGKIKWLEIHSLKENTYYANLIIETGTGSILKVDCRPSDGIALALRASAPIFASETLMEPPGVVKYYAGKESLKASASDSPINQKEAEEFRKYLEQLNARDFWKKLKQDSQEP